MSQSPLEFDTTSTVSTERPVALIEDAQEDAGECDEVAQRSKWSPAESAADLPQEAVEIVIGPRRSFAADLREMWGHRELLYFLVWRDIKVRYKQTVLGIAWAILVPILSMLVFTAIFGNFARLKDTLPPQLTNAYPIYVYAGLLPWLFFSNAISLGGLSLVNQQQLLTKIYFPRLFVPAATVGGSLVDMGLSFCIFLGLMAIYGVLPSWGVVLLPLLVLLTTVASLGIAFLLSALTVSYRDFKFVIPFMVQIWQFMSPVVYPTTIVPERFRWLFYLNPMTGIIDGFRALLLGTSCSASGIMISTGATFVLFIVGVAHFRRTERRFADIA